MQISATEAFSRFRRMFSHRVFPIFLTIFLLNKVVCASTILHAKARDEEFSDDQIGAPEREAIIIPIFSNVVRDHPDSVHMPVIINMIFP